MFVCPHCHNVEKEIRKGPGAGEVFCPVCQSIFTVSDYITFALEVSMNVTKAEIGLRIGSGCGQPSLPELPPG